MFFRMIVLWIVVRNIGSKLGFEDVQISKLFFRLTDVSHWKSDTCLNTFSCVNRTLEFKSNPFVQKKNNRV